MKGRLNWTNELRSELNALCDKMLIERSDLESEKDEAIIQAEIHHYLMQHASEPLKALLR